MKTHIDYQIIEQDGRPAFAVVPYLAFKQLLVEAAIEGIDDDGVLIPHDVVKLHIEKGFPLIKAWRKHLGRSQADIAAALNVSQSAYSQIENGENNKTETLERVAKVLGIDPQQLDY